MTLVKESQSHQNVTLAPPYRLIYNTTVLSCVRAYRKSAAPYTGIGYNLIAARTRSNPSLRQNYSSFRVSCGGLQQLHRECDGYPVPKTIIMDTRIIPESYPPDVRQVQLKQ